MIPHPGSPRTLAAMLKSAALLGRLVQFTVSATAACCVTPPPLPVMVMVKFPVAALRAALMVIVDELAPIIDAGLKLIETPLPAPEADKLIDELKLPLTAVVTVALVDPPFVTVTEVGETPIVKLPVDPVTLTVTVVVSTVLPEVPVTLMV